MILSQQQQQQKRQQKRQQSDCIAEDRPAVPPLSPSLHTPAATVAADLPPPFTPVKQSRHPALLMEGGDDDDSRSGNNNDDGVRRSGDAEDGDAEDGDGSDLSPPSFSPGIRRAASSDFAFAPGGRRGGVGERSPSFGGFQGGMCVVKRDGRTQPVSLDRVTTRIFRLCYGLETTNREAFDPMRVVIKTIDGINDGVRTSDLDVLAAQTAAYMVTDHPSYGVLAARIAISNLQKDTSKSFVETMEKLYAYHDADRPAQLISDEVMAVVRKHGDRFEAAIVHDRDFEIDYFGFKTLERSYLLRVGGRVVERPQHMLMRASIGIHLGDVDAAVETYELMSKKYFIHASPTLFNASTPRPQLASCFLKKLDDDSIEGIYSALKDCATISKSAGGIGIHVHNVRARGSYIRGTNGTSNGLVPMLRNFNATARYVDQGGNKRPGAIAVYLEPWHADVWEFVELRKNFGDEESRCRDLFLALWIPDLFMRRVLEGGQWSLFCPMECPGLSDCCGAEFDELYKRYEREGKARRTLPANELWNHVVTAQIETGTPYLLYKDAANRKSNQRNLGVIKSSNLCTEIMEYSGPSREDGQEETAVCNLASVNLQRFVVSAGASSPSSSFDHEALAGVVGVLVRNLNKVIDRTVYPLESCRRSNLRHRPIGLGVQALADTFALLRLPFDSPEARRLNLEIFETISHAALTASCELARRDGPYETFRGSPASEGLLQQDLWRLDSEAVAGGGDPLVRPEHRPRPVESGRWDWAALRADIRKHGLRNSLLLAPMPTASTAQILGSNECFEPFTSNLYARRVLSGEFPVINLHLVRELEALGLWDAAMKHEIMARNGSVQDIERVPEDVRRVFRTAYELPQRSLIDMAADRAAFVCQSQSLNLFVAEPVRSKINAMHMHAWRRGLKTGCYYLRVKPAADAIKFTVANDKIDGSNERQRRSLSSGGGGGGSTSAPSPSASSSSTSPPEGAAAEAAAACRWRPGDPPCDSCSG